MNIASSKLISVLHAEKPAADRAEKLQLYGRFIGDWETKIIAHAPRLARAMKVRAKSISAGFSKAGPFRTSG